MLELDHRLARTVTIHAPREAVFRYFTDSARWAAWWGAGSTIDPLVGGRVYVRHPGGVESLGEVLELTPPERLVFTYGFVGGQPIPPGSSRVTIRLEACPAGTRLHLVHEFPDEATRDEHVQGWRFQLSVFANVVANELHAEAATVIDAWFAAWSEPEAATREDALARIASETIRFRDRFSLIDGLDDLRPHLAAVHRFMPGARVMREGSVRHCQGTVLADWVAARADGEPMGSGTNVFQLGPDGRIEAVTGLWNPSLP